MINQLMTWWINNFSLQLGNDPRMESIVLSSIGITGIALYESILAKYLGFGEPKYAVINTLISLVTIAFSLRLVSQIYINTGNAIAQRCHALSTRLLNHHGLQPNPDMDGPRPESMSIHESIACSAFAIMGGSTGIVLIGTASYYLLRFMGLPETIDSNIGYTPAILLGGIPGCVFGYTAGRLINHAPQLISEKLEKRRAYQQARAIITLYELPSHVDQHQYLPPEILGMIHSYLIGTSVHASTRIINEVIDERNNNICSMVNNKISFFASRHHQPQQLIEDIEDQRLLSHIPPTRVPYKTL